MGIFSGFLKYFVEGKRIFYDLFNLEYFYFKSDIANSLWLSCFVV
jgi:hypothetical protein